MSKTTIFSDLHAHNWGDFSTIVEYRKEKVNSRLADCVKVIDAVAKYNEKYRIKRTIFAGDLFHRKRLIDVPVFNAVAAAIHRLTLVSELWLLAGNHDLFRRSSGGVFSTEHALSALKRYRGVKVIDSPLVLDGIGFVPYADDHETVLRGLEVVSQSSRFVVMHAGIAGAHTGAIEYQPLEPLKGEELPRLPIYSGHYHRPQQIERGRYPSATYIGAPLEFVRGDGHSKRRGFVVVDLDRPTKFERVAFKGPRFITMKSSDQQMSNDDVRGNFIDLVLDDQSRTVDSMVKMLMGHGARAVNPIPYQEPRSKKARLHVKVKRGLPSLQELCEAYVGRAPEELDREVLRSIAKDALHSVGSDT